MLIIYFLLHDIKNRSKSLIICCRCYTVNLSRGHSRFIKGHGQLWLVHRPGSLPADVLSITDTLLIHLFICIIYECLPQTSLLQVHHLIHRRAHTVNVLNGWRTVNYYWMSLRGWEFA